MTTDVDTQSQTELAQAVSQVNIARHVEIEEGNVASINDQILQLDADNAHLEAEIDRCNDFIRSSRRTIRQNSKRQDKLRLQRDIFEDSAMRLRRANHP